LTVLNGATLSPELISAKPVWIPLKWSIGRTAVSASMSGMTPLRSSSRCHLNTS
jgi:hypothetical protein